MSSEKVDRGRRKTFKYGIAGIIAAAVAVGGGYAVWHATQPKLTTTPTPISWPTVRWQSSTPESVGFDSVKLAQGLEATKANQVAIHSLTVIRHSTVILDAYFYPYDGSTYHDLGSVTKSVMTTLIGIAADQEKLDLDQPILSFFPNRTIANRDALKERITVRHLVSMSSGLSCTAVPSEITLEKMMESPDWIQFTLDLPMTSEPGTNFVYNSPGMHLLSAILQQATGMTALEYAKDSLFKPLGITNVFWPLDPQGYTRGWGDLCLHPNDAAKIGLLFLQRGQWENKQIVSSKWVSSATTKQIATGSYKAEDYGYGWWISSEELVFFSADGRNGQRILVVPPMDLILVTTGGGFETDEVTPHLEAAIVDLQNPVPANPDGVAQLEAVVKKCKEPPPAQPVPQLPDTAHAISSKTFTLDSNPAQFRSVRLDFDAPMEATLHLDLANESTPRIVRIGLDGNYRLSINGKPAVARGTWTDPQTFTVDYSEGPGLNNYKYIMNFNDNIATFEIYGLGKIEGKLTQP